MWICICILVKLTSLPQQGSSQDQHEQSGPKYCENPHLHSFVNQKKSKKANQGVIRQNVIFPGH